MHRVSLVLGGKNAMIVFPDVDVDEAVEGAIFGMSLNVCQGQACGSNSRDERPLLHSDRGAQCRMPAFRRRLQRCGLVEHCPPSAGRSVLRGQLSANRRIAFSFVFGRRRRPEDQLLAGANHFLNRGSASVLNNRGNACPRTIRPAGNAARLACQFALGERQARLSSPCRGAANARQSNTFCAPVQDGACRKRNTVSQHQLETQ